MNSQTISRMATMVVLVASIDSLFAGSDEKQVIETPPAPAASGWEFRATPYGWLTGLDGTTGAGGLTTDVNESFSDVADVLKFAAALQVEARREKWGIIVDGFYACLGDDGTTPGPAYDHASVDLKQFIGQAEVTYRVYETPKAFVDVFVGARYNGMWLDIDAVVDPAGVATISSKASGAITKAVVTEAEAIVEPRLEEYKNAAAADRAAIEDEIRSSIKSDATAHLKEKIERQLVEIRHNNGLSKETIVLNHVTQAIKAEAAALAKATAALKVAELRASVDSSLQAKVDQAQKRVNNANKQLASALDAQITSALPTSASDNKQWVDPIVGFRAQYNINDQWYLAGNADIGGFGVSSDLTWSIEAAVGYNFTHRVSAELGYRYLYTDYSDGGFVYDVAMSGVYTGLNIKF
ncbi:MAG: hypothetical protein ABIS50_23910 [Luteolibacter sp.]|uniref:outer membrane protein n=1 Tax=Luteolibacter sp. TaxID=1962973 RepID=UPI0032674EBA